MFRDGEAFLRLTPGAPASSVPTSSASVSTTDAATAAPPWSPWGIVRDDAAMMNAIDKNEAQVHSSRLPMSAKDLGTMLNNVQRALKMTIGKKRRVVFGGQQTFPQAARQVQAHRQDDPQAILDARSPSRTRMR